MSHALALVVIPDEAEDINAAVENAMHPHKETWEEDRNGWWDYWLIGGRFQAHLTTQVGALSEMPNSFTIVTQDGAFHRETWRDKDWVTTDAEYEAARASLDPTTRVVAVDYHS